MTTILSIAGSDSSGGAGIQGDLKTIAAHGCHGLTAITAITAQNSTEIIDLLAVDNVAAQLRALKDDMAIHAIKIGLLLSLKNVEAVIHFIEDFALPRHIPIVLDPLMFASTGKQLIDDDAMHLMRHKLIPLVTLVTPNLHEAQAMGQKIIHTTSDFKEVGRSMAKEMGTSFLLKGGHFDLPASTSEDILFTPHDPYQVFTHPRIKAKNTHGTGCCLSTAIACQLGKGKSLGDAVTLGKAFVSLAILHGYPLGKGEGPVDPLIHFITNAVTTNDVANACLAVGGRPMMAEAPEEMSEVIPVEQGLVINMGTLSKERIHLMTTALDLVNPSLQNVLLDPVGCSMSSFRLNAAKDLLDKGKIHVLKVNPREGLALASHDAHGAYGVDSDELDVESKEKLAMTLLDLFGVKNPDLIVVITGAADVIAYKGRTQVVRGGSPLQQTITGTGCMLDAVIMTSMAKSHSREKGVLRALNHMNQASERAAKRLANKKHLMTYKALLINELSAMNKDVYLITDEALDFDTVLLPKTEAAVKRGIKLLQYRVKHKDQPTRFKEATILRELTNKYGVTLIINDDVHLAHAVGADGVHLGIEDASIQEARKILGDKCLIGATAKTVDQARLAESLGADYLGVGALYPSPTKKDAKQITIKDLQDIQGAVNLPIYGIGGIRHHNLEDDIIEVIDGVAVISAVYEGGPMELDKIFQRISLY